MSWKNVITSAGEVILSSWQQGNEVLYITDAKSGSGLIAESDMKDASSLTNYIADISILSYEYNNGQLNLYVQISPENTGYTAKEIGIYAKLGALGSSILLVLCQNENGVLIPSALEIEDAAFCIQIPITIGQSDNELSVAIDSDAKISHDSTAHIISPVMNVCEHVDATLQVGQTRVINLDSTFYLPLLVPFEGRGQAQVTTSYGNPIIRYGNYSSGVYNDAYNIRSVIIETEPYANGVVVIPDIVSKKSMRLLSERFPCECYYEYAGSHEYSYIDFIDNHDDYITVLIICIGKAKANCLVKLVHIVPSSRTIRKVDFYKGGQDIADYVANDIDIDTSENRVDIYIGSENPHSTNGVYFHYLVLHGSNASL